jgi:hypothetical protein
MNQKIRENPLVYAPQNNGRKKANDYQETRTEQSGRLSILFLQVMKRRKQLMEPRKSQFLGI